MDVGRFIHARKARDAQEKESRLTPISVSNLPEDIAKGIVKKELYYKKKPEKPGDLTELAILILSPGAEIYQHQHTTDLEYYIDTTNQKASLCNCGESHGYVNNLNCYVTLVSVKLAVII